MNTRCIRTVAPALALLLGGALLAGCDLRRDSDEDAAIEDVEPTPDPSATPTSTTSPAASIMRDEDEPEDALALPSPPIELTIPFPDGASLDSRGERLLAGILTRPAMDEEWPVVLGGHTDAAGNGDANIRASRARAEAVAAWLVERGVDDERIRVIAFGEQNPVAPNALPDGSPNEEGRRQNRRVELTIAPPPREEEEPDASPEEEDEDA